jgi:aspartyl-tRNA(Asn)/glutamyl-tRNA(Gln) amidotransferase subunit A
MLYHTISSMLEAYRTGVVSPLEYLKTLEENVKSLDSQNTSIIQFTFEYARSMAAKLPDDKNLKLWGVPFLIKDNILVEGLHSSAQSKLLANHKAAYTSDVAKALIEEGALIIGYTNMDEFAFGSSTEYSGFGNITKNAHDLSKVAGGTSGGSAVAVALKLVPFALGTDTGGSIRQPASFNGVYGLRPTYGSVSRYGVIASASSFDQVGPLANNIEDVELVYNILRGKKNKDQTSINIAQEVTTKPKIGICKEFLTNLDDSVEKPFNELIVKLRNNYEVIDISLAHTKYILPVYYILQTVEAASNLERFDQIRYSQTTSIANSDELFFKPRELELGEEVKRRIMLVIMMLIITKHVRCVKLFKMNMLLHLNYVMSC